MLLYESSSHCPSPHKQGIIAGNQPFDSPMQVTVPSLLTDLFGAGWGHSPVCRDLWGEEPLKLGGCCPWCTPLTAFIPNNISWRQSFLGNKSDGGCTQYSASKPNVTLQICGHLRSVFSWLQTWKPTLPWDLTSSPRTKQTCCPVNTMSFLLPWKLLLKKKKKNWTLLAWRGLWQTHTADGQSGSTFSFVNEWLSPSSSFSFSFPQSLGFWSK